MQPWIREEDDDMPASAGVIVVARPVSSSSRPAEGVRQRWYNRHMKIDEFIGRWSERARRTRVGRFLQRHPRIGYFSLAGVLLWIIFILLRSSYPVVWPPATVDRYGPQFAEAGEHYRQVKPALLAAIMTVETCGNPDYFPFEGRQRGAMGALVDGVDDPSVLMDAGNSIFHAAETLDDFARLYPTAADPTDPANEGYLALPEFLVLSYVAGPLATVRGMTEEQRRNFPPGVLEKAADIVAIYKEGQVGFSQTFERLLQDKGFREMCEAAEAQMEREEAQLRDFVATEAARENLPKLGTTNP